jgi:hypothetical protein
MLNAWSMRNGITTVTRTRRSKSKKLLHFNCTSYQVLHSSCHSVEYQIWRLLKKNVSVVHALKFSYIVSMFLQIHTKQLFMEYYSGTRPIIFSRRRQFKDCEYEGTFIADIKHQLFLENNIWRSLPSENNIICIHNW